MVATPAAVAHNLPAERIRPIGREREAAAVSAQLLDPDAPLLTLTGSGGMGKTTLALHVAAERLDDFPDGVTFVDLTPLADPALIASHIARAAGLTEAADLPAAEALAEHFNRRAVRLAHEVHNRVYIADALEQTAFALHLLGGSERAARLLGAAAALRARIGAGDAREHAWYYDERLPRVREALSDIQYAAAWQFGRALSREEAVALALEEVDDGRSSAPPVSFVKLVL